MEWLPIETAPKDGTRVIVKYANGDGVYGASFHAVFGWSIDSHPDHFCDAHSCSPPTPDYWIPEPPSTPEQPE